MIARFSIFINILLISPKGKKLNHFPNFASSSLEYQLLPWKNPTSYPFTKTIHL
jgi:hypothetical protein